MSSSPLAPYISWVNPRGGAGPGGDAGLTNGNVNHIPNGAADGDSGAIDPAQVASPVLRRAIAAVAAGLGISVAALLAFASTRTTDLAGDLRLIIKVGGARRRLMKLAAEGVTVATLFSRAYAQYPDRIALEYIHDLPRGASPHLPPATTRYTYRQLEEASNQVAHWALSQNIGVGTVVAIMMDNRPEFIVAALGLAKVGAISALLNCNLKSAALAHCVRVAKCQIVICGAEYADSMRDIMPMLEKGKPGENTLPPPSYFCWGAPEPRFTHLDVLLAAAPTTSPKIPGDQEDNPELSNRTACYIYTSGTTGLPKASVVKNIRMIMAALMFCESLGISAQDRIYCALPLYHSAGFMVGVGMSWYSGAAFIFRRRFSASSWWYDVKHLQCSVAQYIGQLCRYLLNVPEQPVERAHALRLMVGNGMRKDVWERFAERFQVPRIAEFYGSTEGNAALLNTRNRIGAIGYLSPLIQWIFPMKIVRFDTENEKPIRDPKTGFCIPCPLGEPGELLGRIEEDDPSRRFHGYTNKAATKKKILTDVFEKGDRWFRTGDLLTQDAEGFYYFVDRIGDTFRWKGENVATNEVALAMHQAEGVLEANVYGVEIPHHDGRAGMACLVVNDKFSLEKLYATCKRELPSYAQPVFVRLRKDMEITATFKHRKTTYVKEGYDPSKTQGDPVYLRDDNQRKFVLVDQKILADIKANTLSARL